MEKETFTLGDVLRLTESAYKAGTEKNFAFGKTYALWLEENIHQSTNDEHQFDSQEHEDLEIAPVVFGEIPKGSMHLITPLSKNVNRKTFSGLRPGDIVLHRPSTNEYYEVIDMFMDKPGVVLCRHTVNHSSNEEAIFIEYDDLTLVKKLEGNIEMLLLYHLLYTEFVELVEDNMVTQNLSNDIAFYFTMGQIISKYNLTNDDGDYWEILDEDEQERILERIVEVHPNLEF